MHILIVDDHAQMASMIQICFDLENHTSETVMFAEDVMDMLADQTAPPRFDLVMCDIGLAGEMNGLELIKHLRAHPTWGQIPCILMTGSEEKHAEGVAAGANDVLPKPFTLEQLSEKVLQHQTH
jgi:CheY-like chemotaxis protein